MIWQFEVVAMTQPHMVIVDRCATNQIFPLFDKRSNEMYPTGVGRCVMNCMHWNDFVDDRSSKAPQSTFVMLFSCSFRNSMSRHIDLRFALRFTSVVELDVTDLRPIARANPNCFLMWIQLLPPRLANQQHERPLWAVKVK